LIGRELESSRCVRASCMDDPPGQWPVLTGVSPIRMTEAL
jgi:hypothetical protein